MNRKQMRAVAVCVFCALVMFGFFGIVSRAYAETAVEGDILVDTLWTKEGSPYVISSPFSVAATATLSVSEGVVIRMTGDITNFQVLGTVSMHGTADEEILIDAFGTSPRSVSAFGGSIFMRYVRTTSAIRTLYAGDQSDVTLDHVTLTGTGVGIYDSSLHAVSSSFLDAKSTAINVSIDRGMTSTAVIRNSIVSGAKNYGLYVGVGAQVDARHNFWGDSSGPNNFQYNKLGKGNRVYGSFDLVPWLTVDPFACCSSVLFLPGLEASRLYVSDEVVSTTSAPSGENRAWEPHRDKDVEALRLATSGVSVNLVYAKAGDVIDEAYVSLVGPNIYKSFISDMDGLVATGIMREWVPAAYDWRLSLDQLLDRGNVSSFSSSSVRLISYLESTSTPYIIQEFDRLARESYTGRVSIVAHSNGGLVAKALALRLEERGDGGLIDKMVFVGVPQTGTPHAIGSLLHGFKEGIPFLASAPAMRRLGQNMPGAYNLIPSARYLAFDSRPLITFSAEASSSLLRDARDTYGSGISLFSSLVEFLRGSEGRVSPAYADLSLPETLNDRLLSGASMVHGDLDSWIPSPSSELFQIAGRGIDTVSGIEYYEGKKGKKPILLYRPLLVPDGDGTVMLQSAWATVAGPNVSNYWVDLRAASRGLSRNRSHADMLEVRDLRDFISEILSEPPHAIRHRAQVSPEAVIPPKDPQKKIRIFVHAPDVSVGAVDASGNRTGVSSSTGLVETGISGSEYREFGGVTYVSLPDGRVTISLAPPNGGGGDDGSTGSDTVSSGSLTIDISELIGGEVVASSTYGDISLATSSVIVIDIMATTTDSGATSTTHVIGIDDSGDGSPDREVVSDDAREIPVPEVAPGLGQRTFVPGPGSRSGGRHELDGGVPVADASSTEPFIVAVILPSVDAVSVPTTSVSVAAIADSVEVFASSAGAAIHAEASDNAPVISGSDQNIAAVFVAIRGVPYLSSLLLLMFAFLFALAVVRFLPCKISKSK